MRSILLMIRFASPSAAVQALVQAIITVVATTLAVTSPVLAQPDDYVRLSTAGAAASTAGRHEEAYALFQQAHAVFPNARSLRAMAATAFQLRRYADAIRHYEAALIDERRPLTPEQRVQAEEELNVARRLVGSTRVTVAAPGASATIDGDDIVLGTTIVLDPGPHELVVRATGHVEQRRSFTTRGGEDHPFDITLEPVASTTSTFVDPSDAVGQVAIMAPITPPAPRTAHVHVEGAIEGLALQRVTGSAGEVTIFAPLCIAPCDLELEPGEYSLGVSRTHPGDTLAQATTGAHLAENHLFTFDDAHSLVLEYDDREGIRTAGWVTFVGGVGAGVGIILGSQFSDMPDADKLALLITGAAIGVVGFVGYALVFLNDHADIRETR